MFADTFIVPIVRDFGILSMLLRRQYWIHWIGHLINLSSFFFISSCKFILRPRAGDICITPSLYYVARAVLRCLQYSLITLRPTFGNFRGSFRIQARFDRYLFRSCLLFVWDSSLLYVVYRGLKANTSKARIFWWIKIYDSLSEPR